MNNLNEGNNKYIIDFKLHLKVHLGEQLLQQQQQRKQQQQKVNIDSSQNLQQVSCLYILCVKPVKKMRHHIRF